jgi:hypothetical protein
VVFLLVILLVVLVVAIVVYLIIRNNAKWKTVASGSGEAVADVEAKYALLKANGVKCRTRTADNLGAAVPAAGLSQGTVKLEVPDKFVAQATALLDEYVKRLPF